MLALVAPLSAAVHCVLRSAATGIANCSHVSLLLPLAQVFCWVDVLAINQHPGQQQAQDLADLEVGEAGD